MRVGYLSGTISKTCLLDPKCVQRPSLHLTGWRHSLHFQFCLDKSMLGVWLKISFIEQQQSYLSFLMIPDVRKFILVVSGAMIVTGERLSTVLEKMCVLLKLKY